MGTTIDSRTSSDETTAESREVEQFLSTVLPRQIETDDALHHVMESGRSCTAMATIRRSIRARRVRRIPCVPLVLRAGWSVLLVWQRGYRQLVAVISGGRPAGRRRTHPSSSRSPRQ